MKKKALLIGINQYKSVTSLRGCVNDVTNMDHVLQTYCGFKSEDIRRIVDATVTRDELIARLRWLTSDIKSGDVILFHFSGHGSQILDRGKIDELDDFKDEILCLYDMNFRDQNSFLIDDDFGKIFSRVPKGVNLTVILDSCHSGTATREIKSFPTEKDFSMDIQYRYLPPPVDIALREKDIPVKIRKFAGKNSADVSMNHLLLAGCEDKQSSADAYIDGSYNGAFTYNLCKWIRETGGKLTYQELITRVQKSLLHNGFSQIPQLEGPKEFKNMFIFSPLQSQGLTCIYGHPVATPEVRTENLPEDSQPEVLSPYKSIPILTKEVTYPLAQGIILGKSSEFKGTVIVNNLPYAESRGLMEETAPQLLGELENGGFSVSNVLEFQPVQQRSLTEKEEQLKPLSLEVECAPDEKAVLLTQEDGVWKWYYPEISGTPSMANYRGINTESRIDSFTIPFIAQEVTTRGFWSKFIYCLKFEWLRDWTDTVAETALSKIISSIDNKIVQEGFKRIEDFEHITPFDDWSTLSNKKILLFLHGTFSSTAGAFKDIPKEVVERWRKEYPVILGYDHKTLSETPEENIKKMLNHLPPQCDFKFDVVSHSRGGLVLRSLVELCRRDYQNPLVANGVMVGTPNAGTTLADPRRWGKMTDLLTTLANLTGGPWLKILIPLLGGVIRYLSSKIDKPEIIPGLWAQNPGSEFLKRLNTPTPNIDSTYAVITSDFEPARLFKGAVLTNILDIIADSFFGYTNDLVVNTKNMSAVDMGILPEKQYHFSPDKKIHHCNYFAQKETIAAIERFRI